MTTKRARQAATILGRALLTRTYVDIGTAAAGGPLAEDDLRAIEAHLLKKVANATTDIELTPDEDRFARNEALSLATDFFGSRRTSDRPVASRRASSSANVRASLIPRPPPVRGRRWRLQPCPSLADFHDQDLRDTSVTWMALGEATIPEIISVTGHTPESATQILNHYLARHPEMADAAIGKMIARWNDVAGEEEEGL